MLPDFVTFLDGACVACGFGTAYEGLLRAGTSGRDALAVIGLGPVGLAAGLLGGKLGAVPRVGLDPSPERRELALRLGAVDAAFAPQDSTPPGRRWAVPPTWPSTAPAANPAGRCDLPGP